MKAFIFQVSIISIITHITIPRIIMITTPIMIQLVVHFTITSMLTPLTIHLTIMIGILTMIPVYLEGSSKGTLLNTHN